MSKVKLQAISKSISSGLTPLRSNSAYWENGSIPWLKTDQLGEKYIYDTDEKISSYALEDTSIKLNPVNTLSIAMYGEGRTRGNVSILKSEMTTNQASCNLVIDENKADYEYVYYFLKTQYNQLRNLSSGVRNNLNSNDIKNFEIRLPKDITTQKKIAAVLSALDAKIELNNRINAELESLAKTIYDYWFVQFDFPNADGKPYKSSGGEMVYMGGSDRVIPAGWEVISINEIATLSNDSINPMIFPNKIFKYYSIPVFDELKTYSLEEGENIRSNKFTVTGNDVVISKLNPWFNRVIYPLSEDDMICSTEFVIWRTSNKLIKNFLYSIATSQPFISFCTQLASGTSNSHKRISPNNMMKYKIIFNEELANLFGEKVNPIIKLRMQNQKQNQQLTQLRDWLLPMLMNGQVSIK
ncbi:MAG: restriction endonuclease subunit S [Pseudanabaena sp. M046S1SP1A06QC]|nr:restriction endonuclease subunit S [Pseudanabaena sp. M046S1SP1A06QC]